jgi:hypothetical protein
MRRVVIAFATAVLVFGGSVLSFLVFEQTLELGPAFAFLPGLLVKDLLDLAGVSTTNRVVIWPTLLFWWLATWLVLTMWSRRQSVLSNSAPQADAWDASVTSTNAPGTGAAGLER